MKNLQDTLRDRLANDMEHIVMNLMDQLKVAGSFQEDLSRRTGRLTDSERLALRNYLKCLDTIKSNIYIDTLNQRVVSNLDAVHEVL